MRTLVVIGEGNILATFEHFGIEAEPAIVVPVLLRIVVEIPPSFAVLSEEPPPIVLVGRKTAHNTIGRVRRPCVEIETAIVIERCHKFVPGMAVAVGMSGLARQLQSNLLKFAGKLAIAFIQPRLQCNDSAIGRPSRLDVDQAAFRLRALPDGACDRASSAASTATFSTSPNKVSCTGPKPRNRKMLRRSPATPWLKKKYIETCRYPHGHDQMDRFALEPGSSGVCLFVGDDVGAGRMICLRKALTSAGMVPSQRGRSGPRDRSWPVLPWRPPAMLARRGIEIRPPCAASAPLWSRGLSGQCARISGPLRIGIGERAAKAFGRRIGTALNDDDPHGRQPSKDWQDENSGFAGVPQDDGMEPVRYRFS